MTACWQVLFQAKSKGTGTIVTAESLVAGYMDLHLEKGFLTYKISVSSACACFLVSELLVPLT